MFTGNDKRTPSGSSNQFFREGRIDQQLRRDAGILYEECEYHSRSGILSKLGIQDLWNICDVMWARSTICNFKQITNSKELQTIPTIFGQFF